MSSFSSIISLSTYQTHITYCIWIGLLTYAIKDDAQQILLKRTHLTTDIISWHHSLYWVSLANWHLCTLIRALIYQIFFQTRLHRKKKRKKSKTHKKKNFKWEVERDSGQWLLSLNIIVTLLWVYNLKYESCYPARLCIKWQETLHERDKK